MEKKYNQLREKLKEFSTDQLESEIFLREQEKYSSGKIKCFNRPEWPCTCHGSYGDCPNR